MGGVEPQCQMLSLMNSLRYYNITDTLRTSKTYTQLYVT